ncbi:LmeA family phospholipid-binding protein [Homoserinibacter sp. YIM 151385]|uniref:LmeA family phospholipid-binding protein n=1 Tax=Homoserinibacter sp. YIM 151385 TaxID=2985506 RepID=UPI0022F009DC|nr:DUF2993 domain-containing protein [Homoserinibacter sp. YIM 151385]WBU38275.1 DUF2993 domain-containing protein [Homoserinibacter sp. YIM 151385]
MAEPEARTAPLPVVEEPAEPRRRRRRWPWVILGILVLLVVAFFVLDGIAKQVARDMARARIVEVLGLPSEEGVEVSVGEGPILIQALRGRLDQLDVSIAEAEFNGLTGSVEVAARGVPLSEGAPVTALDISVAVPEESLAGAAESFGGIQLSGLDLRDGEIVAESAFEAFGLSIPVGMSFAPTASGGALVLEPTTLLVNGAELDARELREGPFGFAADQVLAQRSICVAESLPEALRLEGAEVEGARLVLDITGDGAPLGGPGLAEKGSCS